MDKNSELARERTVIIRGTDFEDAVRIVGNISRPPKVTEKWIEEFDAECYEAQDQGGRCFEVIEKRLASLGHGIEKKE